jgi:hypothetical protein
MEKLRCGGTRHVVKFRHADKDARKSRLEASLKKEGL